MAHLKKSAATGHLLKNAAGHLVKGCGGCALCDGLPSVTFVSDIGLSTDGTYTVPYMLTIGVTCQFIHNFEDDDVPIEMNVNDIEISSDGVTLTIAVEIRTEGDNYNGLGTISLISFCAGTPLTIDAYDDGPTLVGTFTVSL